MLGSSGPDPRFGASLTVRGAVQATFEDPHDPYVYIGVALRLSNGGTRPLPLYASLFSMETAQGLLYRADWGECGGERDAMLAAGHDIECNLSFNQSILPVAILYSLPDDSTVRVPVSVKPCDICGGRCVDLKSDPHNCGACGIQAHRCSNGAPGCDSGSTFCGRACEFTQTDDDNCGGCGHACDVNSRCMDGVCTTLSCDQWTSGCADCCLMAHKPGSDFLDQQLQACACQNDINHCGQDCAGDYCATGMANDFLCQLCLQNTIDLGYCVPMYLCENNADCMALLDCQSRC